MSDAIDQGKLYPPGYNNANPPGIPQFALVAGGGTPGVAASIALAGGSVTVDTLGGIFMTTSADSFIGLDTFNNISLNTSNTSANATIEMIGQSTITVQASDGPIVIESVANDSFLSLALDVELQSRGQLLGGGNVNITNAGTIAFDTLGPGAITGLSTVNGLAFPVLGPTGPTGPSGGATGPTGPSGPTGPIPADISLSTLTVNGTGNISLETDVNTSVTSANILFKSTGHDTINNGIVAISKSQVLDINDVSTSGLGVYAFSTLGAFQPVLASSYYVVGPNNDGTDYGAAQISYSPTTSSITLEAPVVSVGAFSTLTGISTINGAPFVNGGTVSQDLTVSTLTAGVSLSTPSLNVSSIGGVAWPLPGFVIPSALFCSTLEAYDYVSTNALLGVSTMSNATALDIYTNALTITGDVSFNLSDGGGGGISGTGNDVFLTGVSSINGGTRPLTVSTAARVDIVATSDELHLEGASLWLGAVAGSTDVNVYGNVLIPTAELQVSSIVGLSTITSPAVLGITATTLNMVGGTNVSMLDTGGAGFSVISGVPQINGDVGISSITGLSSINGTSYNNQAVSSISTLALNSVSSINGGVFPGAGWTSTLGSGGFTSTVTGANITIPQLVFTPITFPVAGDYTIYQKFSLVKTAGGAGQDIHMNALYGGATLDITNVYEGIGSLPYANGTSISTLTTIVANCKVSSIGDTKSIYIFDQSANTYTADIVAANPVIQYNPSI